MSRQVDEHAIRSILRRYRIAGHHRATVRAGSTRYGVFTGTKGNIEEVIEPTTHAEAKDAQASLIVSDILDYFEAKGETQ